MKPLSVLDLGAPIIPAWPSPKCLYLRPRRQKDAPSASNSSFSIPAANATNYLYSRPPQSILLNPEQSASRSGIQTP